MKKIIKKIFSITISFLLIGALLGCGNKEPEYGWYYIDTSGKKISKTFEYEENSNVPFAFDEYGIAKVRDYDRAKVYFINRDFETIGEREFDKGMVEQGVYDGHDIFIAGSDGVIEILDENMNAISSITYDLAGVTNISEIIRIPGSNGLFPVKDSKTDLWGYMSFDGQIVIDAKYCKAFPFTEDDVAVVYTQDQLAGTINEKGEFVLEPQYQSLASFYSGRALAEKNKGEGAQLIDLTGKSVTDKVFEFDFYADGVEMINDGLLAVKDYNTGLFGYVDIDGNYVIKPQYASAGGYHNGYARVENTNDLWGIIDKQGNEVIPCQYRDIGYVSEDGLVGIDTTKKGETVNGLYALYGFYSIEEKCWVIDPQYMSVTKFSNGCAAVIENR